VSLNSNVNPYYTLLNEELIEKMTAVLLTGSTDGGFTKSDSNTRATAEGWNGHLLTFVLLTFFCNSHSTFFFFFSTVMNACN